MPRAEPATTSAVPPARMSRLTGEMVFDCMPQVCRRSLGSPLNVPERNLKTACLFTPPADAVSPTQSNLHLLSKGCRFPRGTPAPNARRREPDAVNLHLF